MSIDAVIAQGSSQATPHRQNAAPPVAITVSGASAASAPAVANQPSAPPPTLEQVHAAAEQIAQYLKSSGRALDFHVDSDTGQVVVVVRDAASGETIRQMPSEEALHLARTMNEGAKSLMEMVA